jgi:hypothetical protein
VFLSYFMTDVIINKLNKNKFKKQTDISRNIKKQNDNCVAFSKQKKRRNCHFIATPLACYMSILGKYCVLLKFYSLALANATIYSYTCNQPSQSAVPDSEWLCQMGQKTPFTSFTSSINWAICCIAACGDSCK